MATNYLHFLRKTLLASLVAGVSSNAFSAAFQLTETSISGLGRAFAGEAAVADNASVVATNPALMTKFHRPQFSAGTVYFVPRIDAKGKILVIKRDASENNVAPKELVPQTYMVYPINDRFVIGGGLNVNYGLSTEYSTGFSAGFLGGKTHMQAINANFSGAYRFSDHLSLGLGVNVVYASAEVKRHTGALPEMVKESIRQDAQQKISHIGGKRFPKIKQILGKLAGGIVGSLTEKRLKEHMSPSTTVAKLKGNDVGFGGNIGLTYDFNANNRIGLAYHSPIFLNMKGKFSNDIPSLGYGPLAQIIAQKMVAKGIVPTGGAKIDGKLRLVLPEYVELAGYHRLTESFALTYSAKWTKWDRLQELHAVANDSGITLFRKKEAFKNSWRYALGGVYDLNHQWTLRSGIAFDNSAADSIQSISIPDTDRKWITIGATYRASENLSFDMGYAYVLGKKSHFTEDKDDIKATTFDVKARAMLYGLSVNYQF